MQIQRKNQNPVVDPSLRIACNTDSYALRPEKRYLQEYQEILGRVRTIERHLATVWERATRDNRCIAGARVSCTPNHDKIANAAVELADGEAALRAEVDHLREALAMRLFLIGRMEDERHKAILTARYIDGMQVKDIAKAIGCEVRYLRGLHREALQEFAAVLEETHRPD